MRRWFIQIVLALLVCGLALASLVALGQYFRRHLRDDPRYYFPLAEIECPSPPGVDRVAFLSEVQYIGGLPEQVSLLDDSLAERLAAAFARHAWVERVVRAEVGPGRRIRVQLEFRRPVLAVSFSDKTTATRAVDRQGILLPREADTKPLPTLIGIFPPPIAGPGRAWGDPEVEAAARVAALLEPHQTRLQLQALQWSNGTLRLGRDDFRAGPLVIWGRGLGDEVVDEPPAEEKLRRLLGMELRQGSLRSNEILDLTKR